MSGSIAAVELCALIRFVWQSAAIWAWTQVVSLQQGGDAHADLCSPAHVHAEDSFLC
jgi:hypothetical protein